MEYGPEITVWLEGRIEDVAWMPQEDPTQALLSVTSLTKDGRRKITVVADGPSHLDNIRRNIDASRDVLVRATPAERNGCDLVADSIAFDPSHRADGPDWEDA